MIKMYSDDETPCGTIMALQDRTLWHGNGWLECDGSELRIAYNSQLYEVIGRLYTNEEVSSNRFQLPNFNGFLVDDIDVPMVEDWDDQLDEVELDSACWVYRVGIPLK